MDCIVHGVTKKWTQLSDFHLLHSLIVNKRVQDAELACNLENDRMVSVHFQGKPFSITVIQVYATKSLQLCLTLCDPIDGSSPGSAVSGIIQARILDGLPFPSPMHESKKGK